MVMIIRALLVQNHSAKYHAEMRGRRKAGIFSRFLKYKCNR
jgi:hypothetical protein